MRSALGKVRGMGSAKAGTHHWWMQRVTAIAMVPLVIWFVVSMAALASADHATLVAWIGNPLTTLLLVLFAFSTFYHMKLGLQVVVEDYVHVEGTKILTMLVINFFTLGVGLAAIIAILKISFGS
jgi:succinate dehydrogenase membrane anchor subunit